MSDRVEQLVEYLDRKGCAMQLGRMADDLKWPQQEIEACLGVALRRRQICAPRPGQYEIVKPRNGAEQISPAITAIAPSHTPRGTYSPYARLIPPPRQSSPQADNQEITMGTGTKHCPRCGKTKALDEFFDDSRTPDKKSKNCKGCRAGAGQAAKKPPGGVAAKKVGKRAGGRRKKLNGKHRTLRSVVTRHTRPNGASRYQGFIDQLLADRDRLDQAIETFRSLA